MSEEDCKDGTCKLSPANSNDESAWIRVAIVVVGNNGYVIGTYYMCHGSTSPSDLERIIVDTLHMDETCSLDKGLAAYDLRGLRVLDLWNGSPVDMIYLVNIEKRRDRPHRWLEIWRVKQDKFNEYHDLNKLWLTCMPYPTIWQ